MKNIKAIIFDLGGVILNIDYDLTIKEFEKLGVLNSTSYYSKNEQKKIFNDLEIGKISEKEFINAVKLKTNNANENQIKHAWNKMLLNLPLEKLIFIKRIMYNYQTFLLSNTNCIHISCFKNSLSETEWKLFESAFNKIYFSYKIGMRKPSVKIFEYVLKENHLKAKNVLFIDDSIQHINAAQKIGIVTHHLKDSEDLITILTDKFQLKLH
jgi:putative hydrolase of the HAD superfamily|tara:strand:+ start:15416 stop:16048 length:633 start_codon:yes stop_codon:yes gene_type:complete